MQGRLAVPLGLPLLLSAVLHVLILLQAPVPPVQAPVGALRVQLLPLSAPDASPANPGPAQVQAAPSAPATQAARPASRSPTERPRPRPEVRPAPATARQNQVLPPPAAALTPVSGWDTALAADHAAPAALPGPVTAATGAAVAEQQVSGTLAAQADVAAVPPGWQDALLGYRVALGQAARQHRRYPALARERGQQGTVKVRLEWRAGLAGQQVTLAQGSGHALLDEQALEMLNRAVAQTSMPEVLRQRSFSMVLPVEFNLQRP